MKVILLFSWLEQVYLSVKLKFLLFYRNYTRTSKQFENLVKSKIVKPINNLEWRRQHSNDKT